MTNAPGVRSPSPPAVESRAVTAAGQGAGPRRALQKPVARISPGAAGVEGCEGVGGYGIRLLVNKREVAQYLGLSTRAVERAVARGRLAVRYSKGRHGHEAVFDAGEVRRYKKEVELPAPKGPTVDPVRRASPVSDHQTALVVGQAAPAGGTEESAGAAPAVPVAQKLTLSLAEAAALSGLSEEFLLKAIRDAQVKAFRHGREWRIKRADLDEFVRQL